MRSDAGPLVRPAALLAALLLSACATAGGDPVIQTAEETEPSVPEPATITPLP